MRKAIIGICLLMFLGGCRKAQTDYSYDYAGVSEAPLLKDESPAKTAEKEVKEKIIKHRGFNIRFPDNWTNISEESSGIYYVYDENNPDSYIRVDHMTFYGLESVDTPDVLKGIAIRLEGADRAKAGKISVGKNFPCWKTEYSEKDEDITYTCVEEVYLTDTQHAVIYKSRIDKAFYDTNFDLIKHIKDSMDVTQTTTDPIPDYGAQNTQTDLWSGIEEITIEDIKFHLKDKLSDVISGGLTLYDDNTMLQPGDTAWLRLYLGYSSFLVLVRNDSDIKRSATDCKVYGIDACYIFVGNTFFWDDFSVETVPDDILQTFGYPSYQDTDLVIWELDGQDLYVSFDENGNCARIAIVCLNDAETHARQDAYIAAQESQQEENWLAGVGKQEN